MKHAPREREPADDSVPDAALLRRGTAGDARAFEALVERWGDRVHGFLAHVLRDRGAADDVAQETFVRVFEHASTFDPRQAFEVWLLRIARNLAIDRLRRRRLEREAAAEAVASASRFAPEREPIDLAAQSEFGERLGAALAELAEPFRTAFLLREFEGLSYEEIGAVTDVPAKTVSTRLVRAREQLRTALGLERPEATHARRDAKGEA
ncbi:MAG: sigma-70 family RNA polymerase sigma factor [Planctomycetes bacterium]|nr:sigma-70 family RNA polymerase sigma factor [Planctomycetota bacterium]MCC7172852.1 sigma-70 family RNA polymerase sigma factor [Planctomycetota bacterium]